MFLPVFVCLSVCLSVSKITQKHVHGFGCPNPRINQGILENVHFMLFLCGPRYFPVTIVATGLNATCSARTKPLAY